MDESTNFVQGTATEAVKELLRPYMEIINSQEFKTIIYITIALTILSLIAYCVIYAKAGEGWWKALIPIYSLYTQYKICWDTSFFRRYVLIVIAMTIARGFSMNGSAVYTMWGFVITQQTIDILASIFAVMGGIMNIELTVKLARSFGRGIIFSLGLIFFPMIFYPILAFGPFYYEGAK